METKKSLNLTPLISLLVLLQALYILVGLRQCPPGLNLLGCVLNTYGSLLKYGFFYTILGYSILILLIIGLVKTFTSSTGLRGILVSTLAMKFGQILLVFGGWLSTGGSISHPIHFLIGYQFNWMDSYYSFWQFNPILAFTIFAFYPILVISLFKVTSSKQNVSALEAESQIFSSSNSSTPRVAAGWYPNPLANNAVMYWDGSEWLNIPAPIQHGKQGESSGLAIASFVTAFFVPILPIIFGHISLSQINRSNGRIGGKGLAIAGLVLGYIVLAGLIFLLIGARIINNYMYSDY